MKKLSILFAALVMSVMTFATDFVKVTAEPTDWSGEYILVYENSGTAYIWTGADGARCYGSAAIVGDKVSDDNYTTITIAPMTGGYSIMVNDGTDNGKYIYGTSGSNTINFGSSASLNTLAYESTGVKITSNTSVMRFNSASDQMRFRYFQSTTYTNQQAVQLYKKEVPPVPATDIYLDKTTLTLDKGATAQLTATLTPEGATTEVVWTTSNPAVATVANGLVTAVGVGDATITATITPAEGTTHTATCAVVVVAAPDAPTFTVADEVFEGSMNVAIAAADGMKIYYTTNGEEPTAASTEYTAPFEITATTTVKAIAYDETNAKASVVATKTYTKAMTCAEANAAADKTVINLNTVTVVYVNGNYIYVADATGGALVYKNDFGLTAGQVVKGLKGTMSIFKNLPEIVPSVEVSALTITEGTVPEPTALTTVPSMDNINQYVRINDVTISAAATWKSSDTKATPRTLVAKLGDAELTLYNTFQIDQTFAKGYCNVVGFVSCYNTTVQIAVLSAKAVYSVLADANDETMGTVTGDGDYEEGETVTLTATANDGYEFVGWKADATGDTISTDAKYTFTITEDVVLTALFKAEEPLTPATWYGEKPLTGTIGTSTINYSIVYEITRNADKTLTVKYTINEEDLKAVYFFARNLIQDTPSEKKYMGTFTTNPEGGYILNTADKYTDGDVLSLQIYMAVRTYGNIYTDIFEYTVGSSNSKPTAIDTVSSDAKVTKRIVDGVLVIEKNGVRYNAQGVVIE